MDSQPNKKPAATAPAAPAASAAAEPVVPFIDPREGSGPNRRESVVDRRIGVDRRRASAEEAGYDGPDRRLAEDRRENTGLERRRGPGRRRSDDRRSAEEGEMSAEQFEFVMAIETYKKVNKRMYPTWTEVLEVISQLGYRKVEHRNIKMDNVPEPELNQAKVA